MKPVRSILLLSLFAAASFAQGLQYIQAHYTKYEYRIAMRDGAKLFTSVYIPKDASQKYPIMLDRTPYSVSPYGVDTYKSSLGPSEKFAKEGFIFVYQDVRGCYMSEGQFRDMTPHLDVSAGPRTWMKAPIPGTPSTGWSKTCPTTTATWACGAFPIRASTPPQA